MYREESVSSSFSSVNGRSRGAVDRKVRVNGATLREKIRTKDGKITKAKAQMRKSASALSPEALYFFRDEMEKEAIITPASAIKAMNYAKPGMFGNMVRKAGNLGWKAQMAAARNAPALNNAGMRLNNAAMTGGNLLPVVAGMAVSGAAKLLRPKIPMLSAMGGKAPKLPQLAEGVAEVVSDFV